METTTSDLPDTTEKEAVAALNLIEAAVTTEAVPTQIGNSSISVEVPKFQAEDYLLQTLQGRALTGGCNDAFTAFAFLLFLLALMDLMMNMGGGGKKKRSSDAQDTFNQLAADPRVRECTLSAFSLYRAFVTSLDSESEECARRFFCQGAYEAAARGSLGAIVAKVASPTGADWLSRSDSCRNYDVLDAALKGAFRAEAEASSTREATSTYNGDFCAHLFPDCDVDREDVFLRNFEEADSEDDGGFHSFDSFIQSLNASGGRSDE